MHHAVLANGILPLASNLNGDDDSSYTCNQSFDLAFALCRVYSVQEEQPAAYEAGRIQA